jgi:hypothetical protein
VAQGRELDPYARTAPFYDVMASSFWASLGPAVAGLLVHVDPTAGPVIDHGAGTGRSTVVIADSVMEAEVWAVEPSPSMRWTMTYRKIEGPTVLEEAVNMFDWWTVDVDDPQRGHRRRLDSRLAR